MEQSMEKVCLTEKFELFDETWSPKIVGELNGQYVKLAKLKGKFVWHQHGDEDELFLVVKGRLTMKLREGDIVLEAGEFLVVPRGIEHCPQAEDEAHILLFEPVETRHTGDVQSERTVESQDWI
jgi:mannose-6-phosphate isomerase-like protein (cupin superfamily)